MITLGLSLLFHNLNHILNHHIKGTLSVYQLIDGEYQVSQFREREQIESLLFPEFDLTANPIFQAGE